MAHAQKHGEYGTPMYRMWDAIMQRCFNPNNPAYVNYGARGITCVPSWRDYTAFAADIRAEIGEKPAAHLSIDRIDNSGPYGPGNVRWATRKEQLNNTRRTRMVTYQGETLPLDTWAERLGVSRHLLYIRLYQDGWSVEQAFTEPRKARTMWRITCNGETRTLKEWARHTGIPYDRLHKRLTKLGWSPERALKG